MEQNRLNKIHKHFRADSQDLEIFERISGAPSRQRDQILRDIICLTERRGLAYALLALHRQQVNCGFVLIDPMSCDAMEIKHFKDKTTGVKFRLIWNPDRELRKNHLMLIKRGIIAENVDKMKLINRDKNEKPCYLCKENIAEMNPLEILFPLRLAGEEYFAGANFAYIEKNHFTIMSSQHRSQSYGRHILAVLNDFIQQTEGYFRAIFNGLAGATIVGHEHLQITSAPFPVETIRIRKSDVVFQKDSLRVARPFYYTPLWVIEGPENNAVIDAADHIIMRWHELNQKEHTENVITVKSNGFLRMFIFPRDIRRLAGEGKYGDMASFECGGIIVLSHQPPAGQTSTTNERKTFDIADLEIVRKLLRDIAPSVSATDF